MKKIFLSRAALLFLGLAAFAAILFAQGGGTLQGGSATTVTVIGGAASGAAVSGNPVLVAGSDGTNARSIRTDVPGNLSVVTPGTVQGDGLPNNYSFGVLGGAVGALNVVGFGFNGTNFDRLRTCTTFKTATATAAGNTTVWTPAAGKKFRLMRLWVGVSGADILAVAGNEAISLNDSGTAINIAYDVDIPAAAVTGEDFTSGWVDMGNGYLSAAANNLLQVNLGTAITGGPGVRVNVCGTEE